MERPVDRNQERDPGATPAQPLQDEPAHGVDRGDRHHEFRSGGLRITWSRRRCIHAGVCVMSLPAVFEPGRRPWIDATGARADSIARVVARCPTGALHCERFVFQLHDELGRATTRVRIRCWRINSSRALAGPKSEAKVGHSRTALRWERRRLASWSWCRRPFGRVQVQGGGRCSSWPNRYASAE